MNPYQPRSTQINPDLNSGLTEFTLGLPLVHLWADSQACLLDVSQDDGLDLKILCYITKKSTWNMMNFLKLAVNDIHDATLLSYVSGKSILK